MPESGSGNQIVEFVHGLCSLSHLFTSHFLFYVEIWDSSTYAVAEITRLVLARCSRCYQLLKHIYLRGLANHRPLSSTLLKIPEFEVNGHRRSELQL